MLTDIPDNWIHTSSSGTFLLAVNSELSKADAMFIEEMVALEMKMIHRIAERNETRKLERSAAMQEACAEWWSDEMRGLLRETK